MLAGSPDEMAAEIRRRVDAHGLSMMAVNFSSREHVSEFAQNVIANVRG